MAVDSNLLVVGGFQGEVIYKVFLLHKNSPTFAVFGLVTHGMACDIFFWGFY